MTLGGATEIAGCVNPGFANDGQVRGHLNLTSVTLQEGSKQEYAGSEGQVKTKEALAEEEAPEADQPCGWGACLPLRCCNLCRNTKVVLLLLCCAAFVQGMVINGVLNSVITSLEKRFDLKSADTGLIASCYDIASVLCLIPVSYFGGIGSKPRWLGFGIILMGLGSIVFAIPHYTTGLYSEHGSFSDVTFTDICPTAAAAATAAVSNVSVSLTDILCTDEQSSLSNYKYVLMLGQLLHGAGAAPLYTLGVTYMHENVKQKWSSIYTSLFFMMAIVGPAVGFILGGYFIRFYTDFDVEDATELDITSASLSWVGAWWLGFLIGGILAVIIGTIILGFPAILPGHAKLKAERVSESHAGDPGVSVMQSGFSIFRDLPRSLKVILGNPTFVLVSLGGACDGIISSGVSTFLAKYLEFQFSKSASFAAIVFGASIVPSGGGGTLLGGYLVKRLNLSVPGTLRLTVVMCIGSILTTLALLIHCEDITMAGVNHHYGNSSSMGEITDTNLTAECNADCQCANSFFSPVCGSDDVMYFTACAAGCTNFTSEDNTKVYRNCSCIQDSVKSDLVLGSAKVGRCPLDCNLLAAFMVILSVNIFISYVSAMPALSATLRCVPHQQCSFALGIQWIFIRCLGTIPGPILFGTVIDASCLFWRHPCENVKDDGACYYYNNEHMRYYFLGIIMGLRVLSMVFYLLSSILYKAPPEKTTSNPSVKGPVVDGKTMEEKLDTGL